MRAIKITLVLPLLCLSSLYAQIYNFRVYGVDEGLPQSYVYSISQTSTGFLNVSTGEGFCSFEGSKFKVFTIHNGIQDNFITTHYTDSRNISWLGHYQKGISFQKDNKFYKIRQSTDLASKITCITEDPQKNIWFSTQSKGIFRIDTTYRMAAVDSKNESGANAITFDKDGLLFEGSNDGLFIYTVGRSGKVITLKSNMPEFSGKAVKSIVPVTAKRDAFWIAIEDEGVYGVSKNADNGYEIFIKIGPELGLKDFNLSALFVDRKENLWIADFGEGVRKVTFYEPGNRSAYNVTRIDDHNGLPNGYIQSIFEDFEGNMWFGSFGGGLIEMPLEKFAFFEMKNGLIYKNSTCIFVDKEGVFWVGNDKGLFQYNIESAELSRQFDASSGFITGEVSALTQDKSGTIWIGTREKGVFTYDKRNNKFHNFSAKNNLSTLNVNSIITTADNRVVIATTEGVFFHDLENKSITHLTTLDGLLHNNVVKIFEDTKRRIWFCSNGAGPYYIENGEFNVFNNIPELKSFNITAISQASDGTIWIGTEGDGVFSYNERGGFINYKVSEGLFSNYCYFIITDKSGNIWSGHKNGLSYKPAHLKTFRTYSKTDGLLFTDFNRNSCFRDISGNLWFGTANGLIKYNTNGQSSEQSEPKTNIAGLMFNKKFFTPDQRIEVPYDDYAVKVDYIAISFTDPAKVNFKYRLLGQDTVWRYTNSKFMEFPKLNDGEYTFQLMAANSDNIWNTTPAQVSFVVKPPYWKKAWFYVMVALFIVSISYSVTRYRTLSLLQTKSLLEQTVNEKTFQLQTEKATVERIKGQLELKNKNVTDSINYAQRIQESILPTKESISAVFNKSFIYYKPRDIVSGDFYWFNETQDSYVIAAVDCTGHGVPGAFMSLVGSTLLNELVSNKKITKPSSILTKLNSAIIKVLRQKGDYNSSHDGMDMAICSVNKEMTKLTFSGALRPLYHIRNGVLTELKGNPYFIGGYYEDMPKTFVDEEIDIREGDSIYIFSDGYVDQFGGESMKKFSTKRFKALLAEISHKDINEQYDLIDQSFSAWKKKEDQVDDVLIIGIKF
ncbi:MAG TPA: two-component regulator propeller domain-containing protein [Bacteroidia bacterium]|jgi:ligand-binding sensor domain-containing protein